jgi:hypothetical protein
MLDQVLYNIVGQASNAAGARLGDEIYYGSSKSKPRAKHRKKKRRSAKRVTSAVRMTDERRIQKALTGLGFYRGRIDGQVNSFETRSAIKELNIAYGISNTASLNPEVKDTLIFLGTLFIFDRHLIANNSGNRAKSKKLQVALKIHGYYHGGIDGAIGRGTRGSIGQYKQDNGMSHGTSLDFEEEYQLISAAKEKNDRNLDDSINSLKTIGTRYAQPVRQPVQQAYVPAQQAPVPAQQAYIPVQKAQAQPAQKAYVPPVQNSNVQAQQAYVPAQTEKQPAEKVVQTSSMPDASEIKMYTDK